MFSFIYRTTFIFHSTFKNNDENEHSYEDLLLVFQNSKERKEKLAKALSVIGMCKLIKNTT